MNSLLQSSQSVQEGQNETNDRLERISRKNGPVVIHAVTSVFRHDKSKPYFSLHATHQTPSLLTRTEAKDDVAWPGLLYLISVQNYVRREK